MTEIRKDFHRILSEGLGFDMTDPNLEDTPQRISKMYKDIFRNVGKEFGSITTFPNSEGYNQIILMDNIHFSSTCSHHFVPFYGIAWVAYIPNKLLIGASKPARIIEHYAARPQLQERLTQQVADFIYEKLKPIALIVLMRATHTCMSCRGAKQYAGAGMTTSSIKGVFETNALSRGEALDLIKMSIMMEK
jgi:GTP cyclohydrolase IA